MNTSLSWIKAYVPGLDVTAQEYTDAMTLTGTKEETFEKLDADLDKIVIGQILSIDRHPDADKLIICQVNIGEKTIQIVTGAPNVHVGDKVPVVLDGGRISALNRLDMRPAGYIIQKFERSGYAVTNIRKGESIAAPVDLAELWTRTMAEAKNPEESEALQ